MGICRNCFGRLSYMATNSYKLVFGVTKEKSGPYEIRYYRPYVSGRASVFISREMCFWEDTPTFDSFVQAVKYLKDNLEDLL